MFISVVLKWTVLGYDLCKKGRKKLILLIHTYENRYHKLKYSRYYLALNVNYLNSKTC